MRVLSVLGCAVALFEIACTASSAEAVPDDSGTNLLSLLRYALSTAIELVQKKPGAKPGQQPSFLAPQNAMDVANWIVNLAQNKDLAAIKDGMAHEIVKRPWLAYSKTCKSKAFPDISCEMGFLRAVGEFHSGRFVVSNERRDARASVLVLPRGEEPPVHAGPPTCSLGRATGPPIWVLVGGIVSEDVACARRMDTMYCAHIDAPGHVAAVDVSGAARELTLRVYMRVCGEALLEEQKCTTEVYRRLEHKAGVDLGDHVHVVGKSRAQSDPKGTKIEHSVASKDTLRDHAAVQSSPKGRAFKTEAVIESFEHESEPFEHRSESFGHGSEPFECEGDTTNGRDVQRRLGAAVYVTVALVIVLIACGGVAMAIWLRVRRRAHLLEL